MSESKGPCTIYESFPLDRNGVERKICCTPVSALDFGGIAPCSTESSVRVPEEVWCPTRVTGVSPPMSGPRVSTTTTDSVTPRDTQTRGRWDGRRGTHEPFTDPVVGNKGLEPLLGPYVEVRGRLRFSGPRTLQKRISTMSKYLS